MATTLARLCSPDPGLCPSGGLYAHVDGVTACYRNGVLNIAGGGVAQLNTYFNAFSVGKWLRHSRVRQVSLRLQTSGEVRAEVVRDRQEAGPEIVARSEISSTAPAWTEIALPPLETLGDGAAYLRLTGMGDGGDLLAGEWCTSDAPVRPVRLGAVITTYNRQPQLLANLARLSSSFEVGCELTGDLRVVVVDNASNLAIEPPALPTTTILPSPNLGGCGGFTRGLMHLRSDGWATHVLFMDDDVSFDPEILRRTVRVLAFATDPGLCIAGGMLCVTSPTRLFEAGALYSPKSLNPLQAVNAGRDLLDWGQVLEADVDLPIDYGAWWYFAFPLGLTRDNPLPMFLHGDDVCWGLLHGGHTLSWNGIGLWHDDFELKNGPTTWFYELRNFALTSVLTSPDHRSWHLLARYLNACVRSLLSFKYRSAAHITFGMNEFLRGPAHWMQVDQASLHQEVMGGGAGEEVGSLTPSDAEVAELEAPPAVRKVVRAAFSAATLGGNLLPAWARRCVAGAVPIQQRVLGEAALRDTIVYRDANRQLGFRAERDRRRFFELFTAMLSTAARIPVRYGRLRRAYLAAYPEMVGDAYWQRAFGMAPAPASPSEDQRPRMPG